MLICDVYIYSYLFPFNYREVEAWGQTLASLVTLFEYIDEMLLPRCEDGNLLSAVSSSPNELMSMLNTVPQYSFYGRCLGFHVSANVVVEANWVVSLFKREKEIGWYYACYIFVMS